MRQALLPLCLAALFVTACGQRGPLYLPTQEPPAETATAEADEAGDEQEEEEPSG